jgi:hypothetical protein
VRVYLEKLQHAASKLDLDLPIGDDTPNFSISSEADRFFELLKASVDKLKIDIAIDQMTQEKSINLDQPWRDKIHVYVLHIGKLIQEAADIQVQIKESILKKLHEFDAEVDRGRTRIQVFTDIFVGICAAISEGATTLGPAVRLGERIIGALARLQGAHPILSLPPPEQFDLPAPSHVEPTAGELTPPP